MKPEDSLILLCLRQDFTPDHVQAVLALANDTALDWERIALTAERHMVPAIISRSLTLCQSAGLHIPESAAKKLKLSVYRSALDKECQVKRLIRALSFFHERSLEIMLIKGAALDCSVYQNADYVVSNDVDIIIHSRREDLTPEALKEINVYFHRQNVEFDFFSHHDVDINGLLPIDFESVWEQAERGTCHGYPVCLMSAADLLISLCINSSRKRYFRLKSLCHISEAIQHKPGISWQAVAQRARSFQCEKIVYTALLVTTLTTGCSLPAGWESAFKIHPLRKRLINAAANYLIRRISFYPYPFSGISILGRPLNISLLLPYTGYTPTQVAKKLAYSVRVPGR